MARGTYTFTADTILYAQWEPIKDNQIKDPIVYACRDSKALNYSTEGVSKQSLCTYPPYIPAYCI